MHEGLGSCYLCPLLITYPLYMWILCFVELQGVLKGFQDTLIHVFNKNENALHKSDYFEKLVHRDSIILMGDSLGDLRMAHGAAECHNLLTFGFLNDKVSISRLLCLFVTTARSSTKSLCACNVCVFVWHTVTRLRFQTYLFKTEVKNEESQDLYQGSENWVSRPKLESSQV